MWPPLAEGIVPRFADSRDSPPLRIPPLYTTPLSRKPDRLGLFPQSKNSSVDIAGHVKGQNSAPARAEEKIRGDALFPGRGEANIGLVPTTMPFRCSWRTRSPCGGIRPPWRGSVSVRPSQRPPRQTPALLGRGRRFQPLRKVQKRLVAAALNLDWGQSGSEFKVMPPTLRM
jgi:hypothetical protein